MSRGYYLPCAPFLYLVPEGGSAPAMDVLPLVQRAPGPPPQPPQPPPGPFHFLISEQAKSLVALQELQNEVGALLEFRDLVMETFPHLQQKMGGVGRGANGGGGTLAAAAASVGPAGAVAAAGGGRPWEPGQLRRKPHHARASQLQHGGAGADVSLRAAAGARRVSAVGTPQPKSGDGSGSGVSSAGSSAVQDSGFGTETSSSKEHHSSGAVSAGPGVGGGGLGPSGPAGGARSAGPCSAAELAGEAEDELWQLLDVIQRKGTRLRDEVQLLQRRLGALPPDADVDQELCLASGDAAVDVQDDVSGLRRERDLLLGKVAALEAAAAASRGEVGRLQQQLSVAVAQKSELNARIHDLHLQFVRGRPEPDQGAAGNGSQLAARRLPCASWWPVSPLGALDGIVTSPARLPRSAAPDARKVAAILREFNPVELQRHLLTSTVENKVLEKELAKASESAVRLFGQLDKVKDENEDLRFQLEERNIELEGTRARVRVLEKLQQKTALSQSVALDSPILPLPLDTSNPVLPLLALPMPMEDSTLHNSSTESAHDHIVVPQASQVIEEDISKKQAHQLSLKKRPSKIPLPGAKTLISPKPPSGKAAVKRKESPSGRCKVENSSFPSRSSRDTSWKSKGDMASSHGSKSHESPSVHITTSFSTRNNTRESFSANKSRESLVKSRCDSLTSKKNDSISLNRMKDTSQNSLSSNSSHKRESFSSKGKDAPYSSVSIRRGPQTSARRLSNTSVNRSSLIEHSDSNSKVLTASDSLELKLSSSLASNTNAEIADEVLHQPGDSFSDSLNNISNQESYCFPLASPSDMLPPNNPAYQASNVETSQPILWHSSSSEYFDSINNVGSMFNNVSLLRSCSYYEEQQFIDVPCDLEGLTECDSLERTQTMKHDASTKTKTYSISESCNRNTWVKSKKHSTEW